MAALQEKVSKESRYQIKKGYNIEQEGSQNPANLLTFPLSMQVFFIYLFEGHLISHFKNKMKVKYSFSIVSLFVDWS